MGFYCEVSKGRDPVSFQMGQDQDGCRTGPEERGTSTSIGWDLSLCTASSSGGGLRETGFWHQGPDVAKFLTLRVLCLCYSPEIPPFQERHSLAMSLNLTPALCLHKDLMGVVAFHVP